MITTEARKVFEVALGDISRVRFYEYKYDGIYLERQRVVLKPEAVEICNARNCNAGNDCCHLIKNRGIPFCVY